MTCNALGSLWNQFCQKCAVFCDCSRNQYNVVVGDVSPDALARMKEILQKKNNLREAVQDLRRDPEPIQIQVSKASMPTGDDVEENQERIMTGIVGVAARCLGQLSAGAGVDPGEEWCRLTAASALAGIDLADKIVRGDPLTEKESQRLEADVRVVSRYGSPAAFLWNFLKKRNIQSEADLVNLKRIGTITKKQLEVLITGMRKYGMDQFLGTNAFAEAVPGVQAVFVLAAKLFSKEAIRSASGMLRWSEPPQRTDDSTEFSPDSLVRRISGSSHANEIPELDEKETEVSESLRELIQLLSIKEKSLSSAQVRFTGVLRTQLLAYMKRIPIIKIEADTLQPAEAIEILGAIPRFKELEGGIFHLYVSLKRTIVWEELRDHYGYPPQLLKALKEELRTHLEFLADLACSKEAIGLKVYGLALLYRLAEKIEPSQLRHYNQVYKPTEWTQASRAQTPGRKTPSPEERGRNLEKSPSHIKIEMA